MQEIEVEVVLALPDQALKRRLSLAAGSTVNEAIVASQLHLHAQAPEPLAGSVGIWNQPVDLDHRLLDGDRVELYRPLTVDPMVARRRRAAHRKRNSE